MVTFFFDSSPLFSNSGETGASVLNLESSAPALTSEGEAEEAPATAPAAPGALALATPAVHFLSGGRRTFSIRLSKNKVLKLTVAPFEGNPLGSSGSDKILAGGPPGPSAVASLVVSPEVSEVMLLPVPVTEDAPEMEPDLCLAIKFCFLGLLGLPAAAEPAAAAGLVGVSFLISLVALVGDSFCLFSSILSGTSVSQKSSAGGALAGAGFDPSSLTTSSLTLLSDPDSEPEDDVDGNCILFSMFLKFIRNITPIRPNALIGFTRLPHGLIIFAGSSFCLAPLFGSSSTLVRRPSLAATSTSTETVATTLDCEVPSLLIASSTIEGASSTVSSSDSVCTEFVPSDSVPGTITSRAAPTLLSPFSLAPP